MESSASRLARADNPDARAKSGIGSESGPGRAERDEEGGAPSADLAVLDPDGDGGDGDKELEPDLYSIERDELARTEALDAGYDDPDAFFKGDADAAVWRLAEMLGWGDELRARVQDVGDRLRREWALDG